MLNLKFYPVLVFIFFQLCDVNAQSENITGAWQGNLDRSQFLQLNVIQKGDKICGYTWDSVYRSIRNYCKAYFNGSYNEDQEEWSIIGTSFIETSGNHSLIRLRLKLAYKNGETILTGRYGYDTIYLRKISDKPLKMFDGMQDCLFETDIQPDPGKPYSGEVTKPDKTTVPAKDNRHLYEQMSSRKNKEITTIPVNVKNITLNIYDNATIDGDTVSVFYNDKLIVAHQRLSEKPVFIDIILDKNIPIHKITLFAENLGSIPPNTALVVVNVGGKRYELYSSASLKENSTLIFEYKPK